jgi:RNA polymerase sigma-70 factor (ECF subfamily)
MPAGLFPRRCNRGAAINEEQGKERLAEAQDEREHRLHALMMQALAGDLAAYQRFLTELSGYLRAFLRRRMARLPDDIEDLVQETLLAVHNQRHTYDPARPVTAWLHAIARYKMIDLLRRRARTDVLTDSLDDVDELMVDSDERAADARRDLAALLATLPDKQRLPIVYVKLEAKSVQQAARLTGLSESAVKVGIHRGLKALAKLIRKSS